MSAIKEIKKRLKDSGKPGVA